MPRSLGTREHEALRLFLIEKRKQSGMTQGDVAAAMQMHQPHISLIERGERRVDVVELLRFAQVLHFDPLDAIKAML